MKMNFNKDELEMIAFALDYLHDTDLSNMSDEEIATIEKLLDRFNVSYTSQRDDR
jgi:hypothetical protein